MQKLFFLGLQSKTMFMYIKKSEALRYNIVHQQKDMYIKNKVANACFILSHKELNVRLTSSFWLVMM